MARRIAAVSSFYGWCADEELIASTRRSGSADQPPAHSPTAGLDRDEAARLIAAAQAAGPRDHLLVLLLAVNALR